MSLSLMAGGAFTHARPPVQYIIPDRYIFVMLYYRLPVRPLNQKFVEICGKRVIRVEGNDLGDVLVGAHHDEAPSVSVDGPQIEDVWTCLEVGTEDLLMIYQPISSLSRQEQRMKLIALQITVTALEYGAQVDYRIDVGSLRRETQDG
ncbi:hypothetical protein NT26_0616 [Pseudorhizobium banfieldiae]|uniref:Uncharacterized protein n=1 Tax=Pseudorhizobium banfieldiae TaxID=1125847 RepID=L0NB96_9HYPH|nr:hypothetical protein NT26_0616 [Pseudorhizobium banfieldiae]